MTIAVGMLFDGGILLCADTLYTSTMRLYGTKIFPIKYDGGLVTLAVAGHEGYAKLAVQTARKLILSLPDPSRSIDEVTTEISKAVTSVYEEHIDKRPAHEQYDSEIEVLAAVHSQSEGVRLFVSRKTALIESFSFECLGSGSYLARYIIDPVYSDTLADWQAVVLAMQTLTATKAYDASCGGNSEILLVLKDGRMEPVEADQLFAYGAIERFQRRIQELAIKLSDPELTSPEFDQYMLRFQNDMVKIHNDWLTIKIGSQLIKERN